MSNVKNELIQKLRSDIRSKLDKIGAFVDNELADYIMVLVANQKTKYQMKDDLSLFLGKETDDFVNWLHTTLKNMQMNVIQSEDKKLITTKKDDLSKEKIKPKVLDKNEKNSTNDKKSKSPEKSDPIDDQIADIVDENTESKSDSVIDSKDDNQISSEINTNDSVIEDENEKVVSNEEKLSSNTVKEENDEEVVLHLNPDGGEVDELLQENYDNEEKTPEVKELKAKPIKRAKVIPLRRQAISGAIPSSTIGAVVRHLPPEEDDDSYDPTRPTVGSVASVVRVTERKSSVPLELQANRVLLLKAVKEAQNSILPKKRTMNESEYTPTPIKKRLGEKQLIRVEEQVVEDLHSEDLRNYLNVNKKDSEKVEIPELDENISNNRIVKPLKPTEIYENPQFVVTLDGIDRNKYFENSEITDDEIILGEEMDEEFVENEDMEVHEEDNNDTMNERCRYWPSCKNGDLCEFKHPTNTCKAFPNCRFGDKCLFIHPNCKFDAMCSRKDCPFTHASKRKIAGSQAIASSLMTNSSVKNCKYFPNCKNPACSFYHPKVCHFGLKCRSPVCPFIHPNPSFPTLSVPHPNQLKWKAKDHISERKFAANDSNDTNPTAI